MLVELLKAWYGTAAASALWHKEISKSITSICGYTQHKIIKYLYYRDLDNGERGYIKLHVDDLCVMLPNNAIEKNRIKQLLTEKYGEMRVQDSDTFTYVGIECFYNKLKKRIELGMSKRILKLASR